MTVWGWTRWRWSPRLMEMEPERAIRSVDSDLGPLSSGCGPRLRRAWPISGWSSTPAARTSRWAGDLRRQRQPLDISFPLTQVECRSSRGRVRNLSCVADKPRCRRHFPGTRRFLLRRGEYLPGRELDPLDGADLPADLAGRGFVGKVVVYEIAAVIRQGGRLRASCSINLGRFGPSSGRCQCGRRLNIADASPSSTTSIGRAC